MAPGRRRAGRSTARRGSRARRRAPRASAATRRRGPRSHKGRQLRALMQRAEEDVFEVPLAHEIPDRYTAQNLSRYVSRAAIAQICASQDGQTHQILQMIGSHLLVAEDAVRVHGMWRKVFYRSRPSLHTAILRTCQSLYQELVPILYGHNTFEYVLRDPPRIQNSQILNGASTGATAALSSVYLTQPSSSHPRELKPSMGTVAL
ncbi:unnamed protein product [Parascedosporium putredinis]|uniref:Uncharacterized protein n=1 Tax=Parascedosporium putredinis TaxID=1442378 RepID=A0A9P1GUK4_9PEZI|nr:unnamed protein product [Parascedosporium putredinis]CAI7987391.1 unnamed protein product [Parascedosporium putredinis]